MSLAFPEPGEWPCFRGNGTLDARSRLKGEITRPRIAWKQFIGKTEYIMIVEPGEKDTIISLPAANTEGDLPEAADSRWGLSPPSGEIAGKFQPVYRSSEVTYARVLPGGQGLQKLEFESGFARPTVNGQWQPCAGRCFAWREGRWVQAWETEPIEMLFQSLPIAGDFDNDGSPEVAILPWYELLILDARTGRVKDRCRFTEGRSYGFFGVYDFDKDGKSEFLVQSDFSKHIDVLGYRNGRLTLLWQKEIETDISNPQKILRVSPDPAGDVDGDGKKEVLVNLYNDSGDRKWHITVHDGITGEIKADLSDEYLNGVADIDGDGAEELLTTRTTGGGVPDFGTIRARSLIGGHLSTLWSQPGSAWQMGEIPMPPHVNSTATLGRKTVLYRLIGNRATVALRQRWGGRPAGVSLTVASWDGKGFQPDMTIRGYGLEALALDSRKNLLARCAAAPGESSEISVLSGQARVISARPRGVSPGTPAVAHEKGTARPIVAAQGSGEEIVAFHPPQEDRPATELWRLPGRGQSTSWPQDIPGPVLADLFGDGRRQCLYAASSPDGCARLVASDFQGRELWHHDFPEIPGAAPVWNTGGIILWQTGHFTRQKGQDVLVTIRRSMMHSEETLLLSGRDGRKLWHRNRQISNRGVGGTPFAIADYDGDGLEDSASLHPSLFYLLKGSTGQDILAKDAAWDPVPAKPVYWGLPVAGDFEGSGRIAVFFATARASMTGLIRSDGSLAWWDALDKSPNSWPAFGDFDGDSSPEVIGIGYEDGIRCYDAATGKIEWRMPSPAPGSPAGSASADIDSDGKDEALFVIGQSLYCFGDAGGKGSLVWTIDLPARAGPPAVADADGSGKASILLVGEDGYVYCVR